MQKQKNTPDGSISTTSSSKKSDEARQRIDAAFGYPKGTIRALITMIVIFAYLAIVLYAMISDKVIPETMSNIALTVVAFYFGSRGSSKDEVINETYEGEVDYIQQSKGTIEKK